MATIRIGAAHSALLVAAGIVLWTAGSGAGTAEGAAAPQLAAGDHWEYRVTDNLRRGAVSTLEVDVVSVGATARVRFERTDANGRSEWFAEVDRDGSLVSGALFREPPRAFAPPVQVLAFPLQKGKTWRETIDTLRMDTGLKDQILVYGRVGSPATVSVPAGRFDTVYVYRSIQMDDVEFWRSRTSITDPIWYAASVKAPVRIKREAKYNQKDRSHPEVRTESTVLELVAFRPGRGA